MLSSKNARQSDSNVVLDKTTPLTDEEKNLFAYFGTGARIKPPFRILNPQNIIIGDRTVIHEGCNINAFCDLSYLMTYIDERYRDDFDPADYRYDPHIEIGPENQLGRFFFVSCTASVTLEKNVIVSERVFIGDNNHGFAHPHVPIMQQPNQRGVPVVIGRGTWIGVGAVILPGTKVGQNCVIGANSVCRGDDFPSHSTIGPEGAKILSRRTNHDE